jgi:enoyl-CoA hydratase/carnithine racemase
MTEERLALDGLVFEAVEIDVHDHVMTLTLNRPDEKNAINLAMANELIYALDYAAQETSVRVVVIAARGDVFCSGGDLKMMSGAGKPSTSTVPVRGDAGDISLRIRNLYKPVIVKVQGPVLAGALLMVCNATHVIASEKAHFSAPEIKRGLWPYMVMASLFRVTPARAGLDFIMRGYRIDAQTAVRYGLANQAVAHDELDDTVAALAQELAELAPGTMRLGLEAYRKQEDLTMEQALPYLQKMLAKTIASPDAREGITAFIQKRKPVWPQ